MNELKTKTKQGYLFVCSGGGLRALECHSAICDSLALFGINPDYGRGSSAGAAVLGFHFAGHKTIDIIKETPTEQCLKKNSYWSILWGAPVYDNEGFGRLLAEKIMGLENRLIVTTTDVVGRETMYTYATAKTIFNSTSMPEVFKYRYFTGPYWDWKYKIKDAKDLQVCDGGVYDNIPVPNMREASMYDHIFILVCNEDEMSEELHQRSRVGRALGWIGETTEREYRQVVNDWSWLPNVTILRPPPFRSSLLSWSENYGLYYHAKQYTTSVLEKLHDEKSGPFTEG